MATARSEEKKPHLQIGTGTLIGGFICYNFFFLLSISAFSFLLSGIFYPRTIGLYALVPYFAFAFLRGDELRDGCHWHEFSKNFPLFRIMRDFSQLEIAPIPNELRIAEKKPNAQFVFAVFPHGVGCEYRILMDGLLGDHLPNIGRKIRTLAATVLFRLPMIREMALWTGCVDARRKVAEGLLDRQRSFLVLPGGMDEQIRTTKGKEVVYLKKRKGFIKMAMRKGVPVVPLYVFGSSDTYNTSRTLFGLRLWLMKNVGACIPFSTGLFLSPICPLPAKQTIVFGRPLEFNMKEKGTPTTEELNIAHESFCKALSELFDENKATLGYQHRQLEIH